MNIQELKSMSLHDEVIIDYDKWRETHVLRVQNGWIYKFFDGVGDGDLELKSTTFVPE